MRFLQGSRLSQILTHTTSREERKRKKKKAASIGIKLKRKDILSLNLQAPLIMIKVWHRQRHLLSHPLRIPSQNSWLMKPGPLSPTTNESVTLQLAPHWTARYRAVDYSSSSSRTKTIRSSSNPIEASIYRRRSRRLSSSSSSSSTLLSARRPKYNSMIMVKLKVQVYSPTNWQSSEKAGPAIFRKPLLLCRGKKTQTPISMD